MCFFLPNRIAFCRQTDTHTETASQMHIHIQVHELNTIMFWWTECHSIGSMHWWPFTITSLDYNKLLVQLLLQAASKDALHLEVEMQQNDHFSVARLKERMLYVVIEDIDLVTTNWSETETWQHNSPQSQLLSTWPASNWLSDLMLLTRLLSDRLTATTTPHLLNGLFPRTTWVS